MIASNADVAAYWGAVLVPAAVGTVFAGNVWRGSLAPQGAPLPWLCYFLLDGDDDRCLDGGAWAGLVGRYFIKAVGAVADYYTLLRPGLAAIDAALELEFQAARVLGGYRYTLLRSGAPREYEDVLPGGAVLVHSGRAWEVAAELA